MGTVAWTDKQVMNWLSNECEMTLTVVDNLHADLKFTPFPEGIIAWMQIHLNSRNKKGWVVLENNICISPYVIGKYYSDKSLNEIRTESGVDFYPGNPIFGANWPHYCHFPMRNTETDKYTRVTGYNRDGSFTYVNSATIWTRFQGTSKPMYQTHLRPALIKLPIDSARKGHYVIHNFFNNDYDDGTDSLGHPKRWNAPLNYHELVSSLKHKQIGFCLGIGRCRKTIDRHNKFLSSSGCFSNKVRWSDSTGCYESSVLARSRLQFNT